MFTNEIKVVRSMQKHTENLDDIAREMEDTALDISYMEKRVWVELLSVEDDHFAELDKYAKQMDKTLAKFDKVLNKVIAERMKLSAFDITFK